MANGALIDEACRGAEDQAFCTKVLGSNTRSRTADLTELCRIAIDLASNQATGSRAKIHSFYVSAKNPELRTRYGVCEIKYSDALNTLRLSMDYLKQGDHNEVIVQSEGCYNDAIKCEMTFSPPAFPSPFTIDNNNLKRLCDIVKVIVKKL